MRYRTPAEVRAIPNATWERWVRGEEAFPGTEFGSDAATQHTMREVLKATKRRLNIGPRKPKGPRPQGKTASMARLNRLIQVAYRRHAAAVRASLMDVER